MKSKDMILEFYDFKKKLKTEMFINTSPVKKQASFKERIKLLHNTQLPKKNNTAVKCITH